jgi:NAD(P)-dependent dehydrogenase (short-subunit alcohol dehydrogenase family)
MLATVGLANAYAKQGVRVVGINPGHTDTDRVAEGMKAEARLAGITVNQRAKVTRLRAETAFKSFHLVVIQSG